MSKSITKGTTPDQPTDDQSRQEQRWLVGWLCLVSNPHLLLDLGFEKKRSEVINLVSELSGLDLGSAEQLTKIYTDGLVGHAGYTSGVSGDLAKALWACASAFTSLTNCPYVYPHCKAAIQALGSSIDKDAPNKDTGGDVE